MYLFVFRDSSKEIVYTFRSEESFQVVKEKLRQVEQETSRTYTIEAISLENENE